MKAPVSACWKDRANPVDIGRLQGVASANAEDASLWRWFSLMVQDSRIRWRLAHGAWLVSVDHRHVATETSFDEAMRAAKARVDGTATSSFKVKLRSRT
ncbi:MULTISPECIES: hypothetical protein [Paraburkholderia]|uniref:hypothetical protein n=1 Tax=Paraburkholderia TaxID=1822464 RepID=UPI003B7B9C55